AEIREGRIEQTVEALTMARDRASAEARLAIDERIAMLYLAAYRWTDAIAHAEANLLGAELPSRNDAEGSLRRELGIAPPVWVDLLGAYGRVGDLDRAVRTLVAPNRARHMTPAARTYWMAVAHEHHGDRAAAAAAYEKARARSRGRPRELIEEAIARLGDSRRAEPGALASEVVARVEAAPLPPPIRLARPRRHVATSAITAAVLVVSVVTRVAVGHTWDTGVLVRAGAMVHSMVDAGECWRL